MHLLSRRGRFDAVLGWPDGEEMPADPAAAVSVQAASGAWYFFFVSPQFVLHFVNFVHSDFV
jgi:hypothetical protein